MMILRMLTALIAARMLLPASGSGQAGSAAAAPTRVPVTIALVERLPVAGAPFVVLRRPYAVERDVILLPAAAADAKLFSEAVQTLLVARHAGGDTPATAAMIRVRPQPGHASARPVFPWAQRVLADLRRMDARPVEGVGAVRAVQIWLPPQSRRRPR